MSELPELFYAHWVELESHLAECPIDVDWERYLKAENLGKLHILTVRDNVVLIGYFFCYVDTSAQSRLVKRAVSDLLYLKPEYRRKLSGIGIKLIKHAEQMARDLGAKKLYILGKANASLKVILGRLQYNLEEEVMSKLL